ncbi:MAG: sulfatase-like hydrolase/transferase [Planctomycetes bacterium]|nr:sulfatase-like hydrolase/transferase [Planctomycetota bacterium]
MSSSTLRAALGCAILAMGIASPRAPAAPAARPNIVFILADDLGWADAGYHGSSIRTPRIDRLAREGIRFDRHYVLPTCTPTRVGLMTGRYPSRYGVLSPAYGQIFDDDTVTLAAALRAGGYETCISGKWHMGSPPDCVPLKYGFESSYGYFHGQIDPYTHRYKTGERSWHRNDEFLDEEGHATDLIAAEAVRVIEARRERPLFLYVAFSVPHYPLREPEPWLAPYRESVKEASRRRYAASVSHMDDAIGRIVDALDRTRIRKDTIIIFSSDNGGQRSWHSKTEYGGRYADEPHDVLGDNRPLRGWKGDVYEGGIRVPAFVNWPGVLSPGTIAAAVHVVDWMPTLCRLTGCRPERDLSWDGRDIWPLIAGEGGEAAPRTLYWKTPGEAAVRQGDWKLIADKGRKRFQLFDLASDPYEKRDRAEDEPARVASMTSLLDRLASADRDRR